MDRLATRAVAAAALALVLGAGCGADPTEPRDVRSIDQVDPPARVTAERDERAPSRGLPCSEQADAQLGLCGAATDNYKAAYDDDPDAIERRTWLAIHQLELDGQRLEPVAGTPLTADEIELRRASAAAAGDEQRTLVRAELVAGPGDSVQLRTGPQRGLWGPLLTIESLDALRRDPVRVALVVTDADGDEQRVEVEYRLDEELADAPTDSLEHRGPGGRWHVADHVTATNLELGWE